jgi:hypothetical protein
MKITLVVSILFCGLIASAQLKFPKGLHLVDGGNLSGQDYIYTNGKNFFQSHQIFRDYDYRGNDEEVKKKVTDFFGYTFYLTKDSLLWGTGKREGYYSYAIVSWGGDIFELYSKYNDRGFSNYSKWLIDTIRNYRKKGKLIMFPIRMGH